MIFTKSREKGQVLLVVVLAAVIALTVGLAAVSRTITNTKVTTEEENSQKALSAAEAGVEEVASSGISIASKTLSNASKYDATTTAVSGTQVLVNGGSSVSKDDGADIWLSTYPTYANQWSGNLSVYWTRNDATTCTNNAAMEIVVISGNQTTPTLNRYTVDPCSRSNNFTSVAASSYTVLNKSFQYKYTLPAAVSSGFIARVIPLYADATIAAEGSVALPKQGNIISSTGSFGNTKRTVSVFQGYPRVPVEFFPYNLFLP